MKEAKNNSEINKIGHHSSWIVLDSCKPDIIVGELHLTRNAAIQVVAVLFGESGPLDLKYARKTLLTIQYHFP